MSQETLRRRIKAARALNLAVVERYERVLGEFRAVVDVKDASGEVIFSEYAKVSKNKLLNLLNARKIVLTVELDEINAKLAKIVGV